MKSLNILEIKLGSTLIRENKNPRIEKIVKPRKKGDREKNPIYSTCYEDNLKF